MQYIWLAGETECESSFKERKRVSLQVKLEAEAGTSQFRIWAGWQSFLRGGGGKGRDWWQHVMPCTWLEFEVDEFSCPHTALQGREVRWPRSGMFPGLLAVLTGMAWGHSSLLVLDRNLGTWNSYYLNTCLQLWDWGSPWIRSRFQTHHVPFLNHVATWASPE